MLFRSDVNAKAVAVTGGAAGIGLATVQALAGQGARIAILDRDVDKLDEALRGIQANAQAQESQEREQIVNRLVANSACDLTPDEMQDMPLNVLRKLDNGYRVRNYAGRGLSFASNSGEEEEVLAMPPLVSENGNGGK